MSQQLTLSTTDALNLRDALNDRMTVLYQRIALFENSDSNLTKSIEFAREDLRVVSKLCERVSDILRMS
jgi:hypothetical protein